MKLKLIEFIKNNDDWERILTKKPYCLKIQKEDGYILFKYDMKRGCDFSEELVREARGLILKEDTLEVVCFPFVKFFNVDEEKAEQIDWNTAQVQEKLDGTLVNLWCDKDKYGIPTWHISTTGNINAFKAPILNNPSQYKDFGELFMSAFDTSYLSDLNMDYTYMFELVSPYNKVIVRYPITKIYHLGTRNNKTGHELNVDIGIEKPKLYNLSTELEVKNAANNLPFDAEGYVVVDADYRRIKIKSPIWLNAHMLIRNNVIREQEALDLIRRNDESEFLSYFPEYKKDFAALRAEYNKYARKLEHKAEIIEEAKVNKKSRKDFALMVMKRMDDVADMAFLLYDNKIKDYKEFLDSLSVKKVIERMRR